MHSLTHPFLDKLAYEDIKKEISEDKKNLEDLFGFEIVGMAYPFGTYNDTVISVLKENGIKYARTVDSTHDFKLPEDYFRWNPTCHHNDKSLMDLAKKFLNKKSYEFQVFYVWGHSYEFDVDNNWNVIEEFCEFISKRDDIFYGTNWEIYENVF